MAKSALLYGGTLVYEGLAYRNIATQIISGLNILIEHGALPPCYEEAFRKGAELHRAVLLAGGFLDGLEFSKTEINQAVITTEYLYTVGKKHEEFLLYEFSPEELLDMSETLLFFSKGCVAYPHGYQDDHLKDIRELFVELWQMLDSECVEGNILILPCSFVECPTTRMM